MDKRKLYIAFLLSLALFMLLYKAGIELIQVGYPTIGQVLIWISHALKLAFLILLIKLLGRWIGSAKPLGKVLLATVLIPFFMASCMMTMMSGRIILNKSRPINPNKFIADSSMVSELSELADEMIKQRRLFWVGNNIDHFIFSLKDDDGDFSFSSHDIPVGYDFEQPAMAEDMSKVSHPDILFIEKSLKVTDRIIVESDEFNFCKHASKVIRNAGFDNIKLYREDNVIQYQIYDFIGWDNGSYYVYYYCPKEVLPDAYNYTKQLNTNWYFIREPRFK